MQRQGKRHRLLWAVLCGIVLAAGLLSQTVLATTYVITDGDRVVTYTTFATDPEEILDRAGMPLGHGDTYTAQGAMGTASITVNRRHPVKIRYHGEEMEARAGEGTVGQLLHSLNLAVDPADVVSVSLDAPVAEGMEIRVDRVIRQEQTYARSLAHEVQYCDSSELELGREEVLRKGVSGELLCRAMVTYVNGVETERQLLEERQVVAPVAEVVARGTRQPAEEPEGPVIGDGYIRLPTGEVLTYTRKDTVRAKAYTHTDKGCNTITATGSTVRKGTVAVDPRFIPYGTRMFIVSNDGCYVYGLCAAEDCGGAIKRDRVDLYFPTYRECMDFGRRTCTIYFLG